MKICVIGFGAAAIGFLDEVKDKGHEIHVLERSKDIYSSSISGIRSDGKLFVSTGMGGDISIPVEMQKEIVDFYLSKLTSSETQDVKTGVSFDRSSRFFEKFYSKGFEPVNANFFHIGTDRLKDLLGRIYDEFLNHKNIKFHFGIKIDEIEMVDQKIKVKGPEFEELFDYVVVAVGRSGHGLIKKVTSSYPELVTSGNIVDVGIRYELPDHTVESLNEEMYEFKVRMRTKTGYMVRTFCNNPSGKVVLEEYEDFVTVNGHSNSKGSSENTNFAILCSTSFTEPFNDPIGYGTYISKLGNILAGGRKVILQTYGDFLENKRTKRIGRVSPTLYDESYILGDINLVLPRRIAISISEFMEKLGEVMPGIIYPDNLMYAVEVKFYSNKINNEKYSNLKFIGDCSGHTRSITYATCHGKIIGKKF
jgi:uncharacterized FAD-dependent dehydrogenase